MTVCETRAYNVCAETCQAMGYCRDQSSVQFYFSYLWMICLYIWTIDTYADDTTLSLSVNWNNITSLIKALSNYLENIAKWCTETKCTSIPRTPKHYLLPEIGYNKLRVEKASLQVCLNATNINQILHHKLLGWIIVKDLSFEVHIDELCTRNCQNNLDFWGRSLVLLLSKGANKFSISLL